MKKIIIILLVALVVIFGFYSVKMSKSKITENSPQVPISQISKKEVAPPVSTNNNLKSDTLITYTSKNLGVTFVYPKIDPFTKKETGQDILNYVIEKGNEISLSSGGSVKVFFKDKDISVTDDLFKKIPNCKIMINDGIGEQLSNGFMDTIIHVYYPEAKFFGQKDIDALTNRIEIGSNGDYILSDKDKKCGQEFKFLDVDYFGAALDFPTKYIGVKIYSQDPIGVLRYAGDSVVTWISTVGFIKE